MSHFCVFVIGENVEKQLQPYHEFECTGINDEYVKDIDITEEVKIRIKHEKKEGYDDPFKEALLYYVLDDRQIDHENKIDLNDKHKYGYAIIKKGKLIKAINRSNPNYRWDWYMIGGRWHCRVKLKDGAVGFLGQPSPLNALSNINPPTLPNFADIFKKSDIDFDYMKEKRVIPYAIVYKGEWHTKGRMGWWGMSDDDLTDEEWDEKVLELLHSLDDCEKVTVIDCHI